MKLLAIDCATAPVSCCITEDGVTKGFGFLNRPTTHSQTLMPLMDEILRQTETEIRDVNLFAVSAGPGSFTGVRIGIAAVKGLAFAHDTPCVAVSTLEAMAYNFLTFEGIVCGAMDARCHQVYHALFRVHEGKVTRLIPDTALSIDDLLTELAGFSDQPVMLVGDGAHLVYEEGQTAQKNLILSPENLRFQTAEGVAILGEIMYNNHNTVKPEDLLPIYLRRPQAERELAEGKK